MNKVSTLIECRRVLTVDFVQRLEADYKAVTDKEKEEVVTLGGLHVVGTERHVSAPYLRSTHGSARALACQGLLIDNAL